MVHEKEVKGRVEPKLNNYDLVEMKALEIGLYLMITRDLDREITHRTQVLGT